MPNVLKTYTLEEAMGAIARSNGQPLSKGPDSPQSRGPYNATGKKLGHEYMHRGHVDQQNRPLTHQHNNMLEKSRSENRLASARLTQYLLNSADGQQALARLDQANDPKLQEWLKKVDVTDKTIYGFEGGGDVPKQVTKAAINIRKIGGQLFVASVYPAEFAGERNYELDTLF
jgi:hypothetical protein